MMKSKNQFKPNQFIPKTINDQPMKKMTLSFLMMK